jgi:general secretion pathway protein J
MNRARGFTLVEMMVALALVALMSVAMLQAYRFSQRALVQTTRLDAASRDIAAAQRLLRRLIEQAYPFEADPRDQGGGPADASTPMKGDARSLALSAPASAHLGGSGLYRYALELDDLNTLRVGWWLDRNGAPVAQPPSQEALLDDVAEISIAYLELIQLSDGNIEAHWRETWMDKNHLPALVRIRVKFLPDDRRRWPELVVAPRLNADANCVFDVVSQMCRIAS